MAAAADERWVLLSYRLPRDPSAPRLAVWRRLKRLGVAQLLDGLVALPLDGRNREQLEWVAQQVVEADGEAAVWLAEPTLASQARAVSSEMQSAVAESYRAVIAEAIATAGMAARDRRRTLLRLRRELGRIRRRDYFPPPERAEAASAVEALAMTMGEAAA